MFDRNPPVAKDAPDTSGFIQRSSSLAGSVYEAIFAQLMSLKIAPGSRITVDNLVRELNVSQTPIREASAFSRAKGSSLRPISSSTARPRKSDGAGLMNSISFACFSSLTVLPGRR